MKALALLCLMCVHLSASQFCVGPSASGSGSGADWDNKIALSTLSGTGWTRDSTNYLEDGTYTLTLNCNETVSGTQMVIIRKATASDHGPETGWVSTMGDGQAVIDGKIDFRKSFFEVDGVTGGGPSSWESGHGIKINTTPSGSNESVQFDNSVAISTIRVKHVEITGGASSGPPYMTGLTVVPVSVRYDTILFEYCWVHDIPGEVWKMYNTSDVTVQYSKFARNWSDATVHGDGIEAGGANTNWVVQFCWWEDIKCTYILGSHMGGNFNGYTIQGNVFSQTGSSRDCSDGVIATLSGSGSIIDWEVRNNSFANFDVGVAGFNFVQTGTDVHVTNNIWHLTAGSSATLPFDDTTHDYNAVWGTTAISEPNIQETGSGSPFVSIGSDWSLTADTDAGLTTTFTTDWAGTRYDANGGWTRGALAFDAGGGDPPVFVQAPAGLRVRGNR